MQLEVGKSYMDGRDEIIRIIRYDETQLPAPFQGDDLCWYRPDGTFFTMVKPSQLSPSMARWNLLYKVVEEESDADKWQALVEVLEHLTEDNELARSALRQLEEKLKEKS